MIRRTRRIRYDVIGLAETRRRHQFNAVYDTGEELFLGICDSRGVRSVSVLVNTSLSMNIDSFEQLTTRIGRLRLEIIKIRKTWINSVLDNRLRQPMTKKNSNRSHGLGEVLQRTPYVLHLHQGHHWRFQRQTGPTRSLKNATLGPTD
uniref:DUF1016 family protein n=1 Tax=Angiostrongylus cantonensis TaxID=6313 RepID=A0A0K0CXA9_ANGCA